MFGLSLDKSYLNAYFIHMVQDVLKNIKKESLTYLILAINRIIYNWVNSN